MIRDVERLLEGSRQRRALDAAISVIDNLVLRDQNHKRFDGWDAVVKKLEDLRPTGRYTGRIEVLLHDIDFWFDVSPIDQVSEVCEHLESRLSETVMERATQMIKEGYREGELCYLHNWGEPEVELRGYWSIRKGGS